MNEQPLAFRMRPQKMEDIIGQKHLLEKGKLLRRMIDSNRLSSIILYGPPGTGKTSIANAIAGTMNMPFAELNAVSSGKKDMEKVISNAKKDGKTLTFVDEIHRFNKAQQDYLLPFVEQGVIVLIGASTENPYHNINHAILSRCQILELEPLTPEDVEEGIKKALLDKERGLGDYNVSITNEAMQYFSHSTQGDIRSALNSVEMAVLSTEQSENGVIEITEEIAQECLQNKGFYHDKSGDQHYNILSAFQKSIRGSDVDAALHYLARLIMAGDMTSINRRLSVICFEDIGMANWQSFSAVMAAIDCAERVGFPEARIPLADAVVLLCLSPKSNSAYSALDAAMADIKNNNLGKIPRHLRDSHYKGAAKLGNGVGYLYPHAYPGGWVKQQYLPDELKGRQYYHPKQSGMEKSLGAIYEKLKEKGNE